MIKAKNLWEQNAIRKLTTAAAVDAEIERCRKGAEQAFAEREKKDWLRKVLFLQLLREELQ